MNQRVEYFRPRGASCDQGSCALSAFPLVVPITNYQLVVTNLQDFHVS